MNGRLGCAIESSLTGLMLDLVFLAHGAKGGRVREESRRQRKPADKFTRASVILSRKGGRNPLRRSAFSGSTSATPRR